MIRFIHGCVFIRVFFFFSVFSVTAPAGYGGLDHYSCDSSSLSLSLSLSLSAA